VKKVKKLFAGVLVISLLFTTLVISVFAFSANNEYAEENFNQQAGRTIFPSDEDLIKRVRKFMTDVIIRCAECRNTEFTIEEREIEADDLIDETLPEYLKRLVERIREYMQGYTMFNVVRRCTVCLGYDIEIIDK